MKNWRCGTTRRAALAALVLGLVALTAAALASAAPARHTQAQRLYSIRLGILSGTIDPTLLYLMKSGAFLQAGLNVDIVNFDSGVPQVPALVGGNIDMGYMAASPMIAIAARGTDVRAVALAYTTGTQGLVVHPDSGIDSIEDLKGKKVGYVRGSIQEFALGKLLAQHGMTLGDIQSVNVPVALMPAAYDNKSVDALYAAHVSFVKIQTKGGKVLVRQEQIKGATVGGVSMYVARGDFIKKYPEALRRFARALDLGVKAVTTKPQQAKLLLTDVLGLTLKEAQSVVQTVRTPPIKTQADPKYTFSLTGRGLVNQLQPVVQFMAAAGQIPSSISASQLVDGDFVKAVAGGGK